MKCSKVRKKLSAYLDEELEQVFANRIRTHFDHCAHCRIEAEHLKKMYSFIDTAPDIPLDPYMATRVRALVDSKTARPWQSIGLAIQKALMPTIVAAGLGVGILLGVQLNGALQSTQIPLSEESAREQHIDANMFTTTPSGSLTASFINLTSATE